LSPSKGFAIGVLSNKSGGGEVLRSVTDFALAKLDALHPERPASVELAPDRSRYEGEYAWDHGVIAVDATDKGLVVLLEDGTTQHFLPVASDEFISGAGEELSFPSPGLVRLDERLGRELRSVGVTP
jgi:hypothetical protein